MFKFDLSHCICQSTGVEGHTFDCIMHQQERLSRQNEKALNDTDVIDGECEPVKKQQGS